MGVVAASVWDHAGERSPLRSFWQAARELDPDVHDESDLAGAREGHLAGAVRSGGTDVGRREATVEASVEYPSFDEWWEPFTLGVGPAGAYAQSLDDPTRERITCPLQPGAPGRPRSR